MPDEELQTGSKFMQKVTFGADLAMIAAMVSLCVWVGRQAEKIDTLGTTDREQTEAIRHVTQTTDKMSGQVLQMATQANELAEVRRKVSVQEAKIEAQESFNRELKQDMVMRLQRIETKLDQR